MVVPPAVCRTVPSGKVESRLSVVLLPDFLSLIITDLLPSSWRIFQSAFHSDKYTLSTLKNWLVKMLINRLVNRAIFEPNFAYKS